MATPWQGFSYAVSCRYAHKPQRICAYEKQPHAHLTHLISLLLIFGIAFFVFQLLGSFKSFMQKKIMLDENWHRNHFPKLNISYCYFHIRQFLNHSALYLVSNLMFQLLVLDCHPTHYSHKKCMLECLARFLSSSHSPILIKSLNLTILFSDFLLDAQSAELKSDFIFHSNELYVLCSIWLFDYLTFWKNNILDVLCLPSLNIFGDQSKQG